MGLSEIGRNIRRRGGGGAWGWGLSFSFPVAVPKAGAGWGGDGGVPVGFFVRYLREREKNPNGELLQDLAGSLPLHSKNTPQRSLEPRAKDQEILHYLPFDSGCSGVTDS